MVFTSISFLFYFLPSVLLFYFIIPKRFRKLRNIILLLFSLLFYFIGEPRAIFWMIISIVIDYISGLLIGISQNEKKRKIGLIIGLVSNLSILIYFKYMNFFLENVSSLFNISIEFSQVIMPIGISFYTFQGMSYIIDVYQNTVSYKKNPLDVALYISLFPQLIAGPIVRYETVAEQIDVRDENIEYIATGIARFIVGVGKKMLLANKFGLIANEIFTRNTYMNIGFSMAWFGSIAYALQIFFDFSGYSDMAIGLGRIFGFDFDENFNYPYISKSITEFWRRWHMSLGSWFRDYVYIPLGGNRVSVKRHILNILIVWFLTGFWHGASWNYIIWGMYFGLILIIEKYLFNSFKDKIPDFIKHIYSLILILIGWAIFRNENILDLKLYLQNMFGVFGLGNYSYIIHSIKQYYIEIIFGIILSTPILKKFEIGNIKWFNIFLYIIIFILSIISVLSSSFNPFIYFRF